MSDQRDGGIAWTDETWNPTRGCSRVSPGLDTERLDKLLTRLHYALVKLPAERRGQVLQAGLARLGLAVERGGWLGAIQPYNSGTLFTTRHLWEADHIAPRVEAGGCGLEGLRTLCIPCHKAATRDLTARLVEARRVASGQARQEPLPIGRGAR